MSFPFFHVDAFTRERFRGNPAGVCLLETPADPAWMQSVAAEINVSETAFLWPEGDGFRLRWFTPTVEVPLCGHGTLSAAHVLWESGRLSPDRVARFAIVKGALEARSSGDWIEMDFPAFPDATPGVPDEVAQALGFTPRTAVTVAREALGEPTCLVELDHEDEVRGLVADMEPLRHCGAHGLIVTARASRTDSDFVSRYFVPSAGIDEDPVTGSAHCCLAPYWARKLGRTELVGYQASRRGGYVGMKLNGDRVTLRGQAVTVTRGELLS